MSESASDSLAAMKKLRVAELREQLSVMGLPTSGLKSDLVDRLFKALHPDHAVNESEEHNFDSEKASAAPTEGNDEESGSPASLPSPKQTSTPLSEDRTGSLVTSAFGFLALISV